MKKVCLMVFIACLLGSSNVFGQNAEIRIDQDPLIPELLVLKAKMTENNKLGNRYKIQLSSNERLSSANKTKNQFNKKYDQWPVQVEYESPNYKVWVGSFTSKLAAERAFVKLREDFKSAFIFRPKH